MMVDLMFKTSAGRSHGALLPHTPKSCEAAVAATYLSARKTECKRDGLTRQRTHTHTSNLGFSVNAIVSMGRKAMERHGEESERLVGVSTSCWSSLLNDRSARLSCKTNAAKGRFWGSIMKNHEPKTWKVESQHGENSAGTQCGVPHCFTTN